MVATVNINDFDIIEKPPPHDGYRCVAIHAHICDNTTGEVRKYVTDALWDEDGDMAYYWSDGSAGCDCNRALFFGRANGEDPGEDETPCGSDRYSVNLINPKTGEVLYEEFNP